MYWVKVIHVLVGFESTVSLAVPDVNFVHWFPVGGGERELIFVHVFALNRPADYAVL